MIDWLLSTLWYGSFASFIVGAICIVRPVRWLGLRTRRRALATMGGAVLLVTAIGAWTPRTEAVLVAQSSLDGAAPAYQFREKHSLVVNATPTSVMRAIKTVAADEIAFFQVLTAVRRLGRPAPEGLLNAPPGKPVMDVATRTGFTLLADDAREVVLGAVLTADDPAARGRARDVRAFQTRRDRARPLGHRLRACPVGAVPHLAEERPAVEKTRHRDLCTPPARRRPVARIRGAGLGNVALPVSPPDRRALPAVPVIGG